MGVKKKQQSQMGYRRLLAKYMQHVNNHSGSIWLDGVSDDALTPRDFSELRSIWQMIEREKALDSQGDYNERARAIYSELELSSTELANQMGWAIEVVEQWLLEPEDLNFRRMSKRDFDHFYRCVEKAR